MLYCMKVMDIIKTHRHINKYVVLDLSNLIINYLYFVISLIKLIKENERLKEELDCYEQNYQELMFDHKFGPRNHY
jgi:cell shape-determining protein MreC